jgi:hypothetical protein
MLVMVSSLYLSPAGRQEPIPRVSDSEGRRRVGVGPKAGLPRTLSAGTGQLPIYGPVTGTTRFGIAAEF